MSDQQQQPEQQQPIPIATTPAPFVALVAPPPNAITPAESDNHRGVQCGACGSGMAGARFKCLVCADVDLCEYCVERCPVFGGHCTCHPMVRVALTSDLDLWGQFHNVAAFVNSLRPDPPVMTA